MSKRKSKKTSKSNTIIRKYMPHVSEVEDYRGDNIVKLWKKEKIEKAFKSLDKPNRTVNSQFSEFKRAIKFNPVTIFSALLTTFSVAMVSLIIWCAINFAKQAIRHT